jgi:AcrR family transcriptional regulator
MLAPASTDRTVGRSGQKRMTRDTRTDILHTARTLFIRQGYAATSMRQVAHKTGIAKATIYHHFPDKRDIMGELLHEAQESMKGTLRELSAEDDPRARLEAAACTGLRFLSQSADLLQIARREVPGMRERLQTDVGRFLHACERSIAEAIAEGRKSGIFRDVDPAEAARVFMVMLQGSFTQALFRGVKPRPPQKAAATLLDVFFHGIAGKTDREER